MSEAPFLPFARPTLSEETYADVEAVLRSGWLTTGPRVAQFEQDLSAYFGGRAVRCLASATAGLQLALMAIGLKPGDEVITTPLTFVATLNTIVQAGGKPVLVDIDPDTRNMDVKQLGRAITAKTRAIMPVHFAGLPVDMDPVYELAKQYGLRVIEDTAHAIGAEYKGKRIGSFGDIAVMSFHPNKNMTTGEGGAVVTDDKEVLRQIERLRFHGIDREAFNRFSKGGSQHYDVVLPGFKYNMMDIQAAIGLRQLPMLDGFIDSRKVLVEEYRKRLSGIKALSLPTDPSYSHRHAWHLLTALVPERDAFIEKMKEKNIGIGMHYVSAHLFTYYRETFGFKQGDFPNAERVGSQICSLPLFPRMTQEELDRVVKAIEETLS
ncbi:MAG TPA: DegT/DnrJ/EryC1/StrS aminotransferase family protein [Rickettsiales bacterium]|nr:DegT/DnrJ/EryC1/StrS aminotransferase family protein [Rickettsiales bacterium]